MKLSASVLLAALAATTSALGAQTAAHIFTDPANLRGERASPRTGHELPIDRGASGLTQLLRKLDTRASLMNIVAHPDDEDGGMLTFVSRGLGGRVADLSLTRGEGGQNAMTGDFEDALGLLRTQELLSSDRFAGVDQFFGTEVDFGFSKTKQEAFAKWTHDRVLYDVVRAIRIYRPLVLTSTFIGGVTDGHGQHQVSGQIAQEAFLAAGDPRVFPELTTEGILPWQPLRIYARVAAQSITPRGLFDYATGQYIPARFTNYVTGEVTTTTPSADVIVHEGAVDPLLTNASANRSAPDYVIATSFATAPLSYVQFARIGLGLQRSQIGPGVRNAPSGIFDVAYHLYGEKPTPGVPQSGSGRNPEGTNFFTGIDISFDSIATLAPAAPEALSKELQILGEEIKEAIRWNADPTTQAGVPDLLADVLKRVDFTLTSVEKATLPADQKFNVMHELRTKRVQLNDALALALDLQCDANVAGPDQPVDSPVLVTVTFTSTPLSALYPTHEWLETADGRTSDLEPAQPVAPSAQTGEASLNTVIVSNHLPLPVTRPYFLRDSIESPVYTLSEPQLRNAPATPPALTAWATVNFRGATITVGGVTHSGPQPVMIVSRGNLLLSNHAQVLPIKNESLPISAYLMRGPAIGNPGPLRLFLVDKAQPGHQIASQNFSFNPLRSVSDLIASPTIKAAILPNQAFTLQAVVTEFQHDFTEGYRPIGYGDLPRTNYFIPATVRVVPVEVNLPVKRSIAYLPGTGDAVPEALTSVDLTPAVITISDLTPERLKAYDTVILGVRTYAAHPDLHGGPTRALIDYARNGGNVLVQYQTTEFTADDAPYPLSLGSNEKVVDETAPVRLLDPSATLLTTPNRITPSDFNGWNEERGHGFLATWDDRYIALTETHDPGAAAESVAPQAPQRGGLITTNVGKGRWSYCAFALYRQLPEAVPGAFRLFMNLINP